jgi:predicted DNA-binding protein
MVRTQVYLSEENKEALTRLAEEKGTSQSAVIREALDVFLLEEEDEKSDEEEALENLRAARGIWRDRENVHEEFREIRECVDRNVWAWADKRDQESDE